MALRDDGRIQPSWEPYDTRVVGVVAVAGNYRPGIVLDHRGDHSARAPVSILGKASCKADAGYGRVRVGDLLTSSPTRGHAMRVDTPGRAVGSLLGKALPPLDHGTGLVDVLIGLQ